MIWEWKWTYFGKCKQEEPLLQHWKFIFWFNTQGWVKNVYKWFEIVYELDLINGNGNGSDGRSINRWIEFKL